MIGKGGDRAESHSGSNKEWEDSGAKGKSEHGAMDRGDATDRRGIELGGIVDVDPQDGQGGIKGPVAFIGGVLNGGPGAGAACDSRSGNWSMANRGSRGNRFDWIAVSSDERRFLSENIAIWTCFSSIWRDARPFDRADLALEIPSKRMVFRQFQMIATINGQILSFFWPSEPILH
jgi:hypothetical protein